MCLITPDKTLYTAEEDMIVYKVLEVLKDKLFSVHEKFPYELNKLYVTKMESDGSWHAYGLWDRRFLKQLGYVDAKGDFIKSMLICIGPGFHSASVETRLNPNEHCDRYLFECTIPKGSLYYKGVTDLLVSNQIVINKQL